MNKIEKLNERIAQLTDLVKSGEETISATKEMLKLAEQERDRLADQRREQEPKFERVDNFYYLDVINGAFGVGMEEDQNSSIDDDWYNHNNYFHTKKRAREVADKINLLLKLERLHDTFCPDYVPDWGNDVINYTVDFDIYHKKWYIGQTFVHKAALGVYFSTKEIAQKVCDILNAELEEHYES